MSSTDDVDKGLGNDAKKLLRRFTENKPSVDKDDLLDQIEERLRERGTFMRLPFTLLLFISFAVFALGHEHIGDSSLVQREMRGMLEGTTYEGVTYTSGHKDHADIDTKEDIYNYLREAVIPLFITPIGTRQNERHRALRYNRIIGGVVLQQVRRKGINCADEYPEMGPLSTQAGVTKTNPILDGFVCYPWNTEADDCFGPDFAGETREGFCPDSKVFQRDEEQAARRLKFVPDGGGTGGSSIGKLPVPANRSYYSVYLYEYEGLETALAKINTLERDEWIDYHTAWMGVRIMMLNPDLEMYVHATVNVYMPPSGAMLPHVYATSFQGEPYSSQTTLAVDAFFGFCVVVLTLATLRSLFAAIRREQVRAYFADFWHFLDIFVMLFSWTVGLLWVILVQEHEKTTQAALNVREAEPLPGESNAAYPRLVSDLHYEMLDMIDYLQTWRVVLCWFTLLISLKFLECFSNQPRLAVVTKTILRASPDFFHFLIVFFFIFFAFVISGMMIFGRRLWNWSNISMATNEAFLMLVGDFDYDELTYEHAVTANLWFWLFILLINNIMLNMVMAIVMDVYTEVKGETSGFAPIWTQFFEICMVYYNVLVGKSVPDSELLRLLRDAEEDEFDEDSLMNRVGPGLSREAARSLITQTRAISDERLQGAVSLSEAMSMIAWVKLAVQKIEMKLEDVFLAEKQEREALERVNSTPGGLTTVALTPDSLVSAYLSDTAMKINKAEAKLADMEQILQEGMNFSGLRGKDLRDRMQVIEDLLRGQRDAMVRNSTDVWNKSLPMNARAEQRIYGQQPGEGLI